MPCDPEAEPNAAMIAGEEVAVLSGTRGAPQAVLPHV